MAELRMMASDTKEFEVVRICRSDGMDSGPGYWPPPPPAAGATTTPAVGAASIGAAGKKVVADAKGPRARPQMTRLAEDDPRYTEWRVKIGILLKQELSPHPEEGNAWYVPFPKGYWLYERSKHLWVSGYPIKSKLFKTPQEFALHLIWLLSASKDYRDCSCVHCNVPNIAKLTQTADESPAVVAIDPPPKPEKPVAKAPPAPKPVPIPKPATGTVPKVTPVPLPHIPGQPTAPGHSPSPAKQLPPKPVVPTPSPVNIPTGSIVTPTMLTTPAPPPIPQPQKQAPAWVAQGKTPASAKPALDTRIPNVSAVTWTMKSSALFRVGELTWYQNGNTWRLGVISGANGQNFEMLPIGHSMIPRASVSKTPKDLRPFYAFSVPGVAVPDLKDKSFDDIPWEVMFQAVGNDTARRDLLALDASKMAASKIDCSFSLWAPQGEDPNAKFTAYAGGFLGAERVELGDCLRLKPVPMDTKIAPDALIMGLRTIFTINGHPNTLHFRGHLYMLVRGETASATPSVPEEHLPLALREECKWRNRTKPASNWRCIMVKENASVKEPQIRGRFYPTFLLGPIMNPQNFSADSPMAQLNSRMDGSGRPIGQKRNRLDMLGASVPPTAQLAFEALVKEMPSN